MSSETHAISDAQHEFCQRISRLDKRWLANPTREEQGLAIYQNNLLMTAARAISITYPVLTKMLGAEAMVVIAKRLLAIGLPRTGDWATWGDALADVLRESELVTTLPLLPDMADLEWRVHLAGRVQLRSVQQESLTRLRDDALDKLSVYLQPGISVLASEYPLAALWQAHEPWTPAAVPSEDALQTIMANAEARTFMLIYQRKHRPQVRVIDAATFHWFRDILQGRSVAELLAEHQAFDIANWLALAVEQPWLERLDLSSVE